MCKRRTLAVSRKDDRRFCLSARHVRTGTAAATCSDFPRSGSIGRSLSTADMLRFLRSVQSRPESTEDSDSPPAALCGTGWQDDPRHGRGEWLHRSIQKPSSIRCVPEPNGNHRAGQLGLVPRSTVAQSLKRLSRKLVGVRSQTALDRRWPQKKLQGRSYFLPSSMRWVFDEFRQNYQDCGSRCVDPRLASSRANAQQWWCRCVAVFLESNRVFCRRDTRQTADRILGLE